MRKSRRRPLALGALLAAGLGAGTLAWAAGPPRSAGTPVPTPTPFVGRRGKTGAMVSRPPVALAPGDRISLDLKDADLRDVLRSFGRLAHLNLVIDPEVRGSVTVQLHDVRWEDALEVILRSNGLGSVQERSLVRVGRTSRLADEPGN